MLVPGTLIRALCFSLTLCQLRQEAEKDSSERLQYICDNYFDRFVQKVVAQSSLMVDRNNIEVQYGEQSVEKTGTTERSAPSKPEPYPSAQSESRSCALMAHDFSGLPETSSCALRFALVIRL